MPDLFGNDTPPPKKRKSRARGYAWPPGSGPEGETCKTCKHCVRRAFTAGTYHKCLLMRASWTGGKSSDILVRSPACRMWEREEDA